MSAPILAATPIPGRATARAPFDGETVHDIIFTTSDNVEFYVAKAILFYSSPFFADMFSLPQPSSPEASSESDSCAHPRRQDVVHVDDSHQDLRHILKALLPSQRSK